MRLPLDILDLKPNNILIRPEQIESIITAELLDNPTLTKWNRPHYLPKGLIRYWSQPIPPWLDVSRHIVGDIGLEVALVDLGHGKLFKSVHFQEVCPSPELTTLNAVQQSSTSRRGISRKNTTSMFSGAGGLSELPLHRRA
jgi:hypothetical protein